MKEETKRKISKSMLGKNVGKKFSDEHKKKLSESKKKFLSNPKNHPLWKGKEASYRSIHAFIVRKYGKADVCEECRKKGDRIHWANIDHKYSRNRNKWKKLCAKCHGSHDKLLNLRKNKKYVCK